MLRKTPLAVGETYHVYNRGAHKQNIYSSEADYARFMFLLFVANDPTRLNMRDLLSKYKGRSFADIFEGEKPEKSLVDILAYSLMPNHFHLVLRQKTEQGISSFLRKIMTGYSMYFNIKYGHSGVLFQGRFKSSHIDTEPYFRYIFSYVHLNPLSLIEPGWEEKGIQNKELSQLFMSGYPYSSYCDYVGIVRSERAILVDNNIPDFLTSQNDVEDLFRFTKDRPL